MTPNPSSARWLVNVEVDYVDGTKGNYDAWVTAADDVAAEQRAIKKAEREALNADEARSFSVAGVHLQYGTGDRVFFDASSPYWKKGERSGEIVGVDLAGDIRVRLDGSGQTVKLSHPSATSGYSFASESNPRQRELAARLARGES